ncbi:unnamed protein product [Effrenium voratum]|nr:unnamed protein product [Effrenium voratum]|mmetsp:Transcript_34055/g.81739  ORF Transcript_34055/g.81739 Transcript_34055/m.81739 type:complete len:272 (+) Transcript_34055:2-817(+)
MPLLHGIGDLVKRLEQIAEACDQKPKQDQPKDEFLRLKQRVYVLLEEARRDIHERQTLLSKRGNCKETIQKGNSVRQALEELRRALPKLQALHKKAQNQRGAKAKREELQARYQDIRILKRHVDELNELFGRASEEACPALLGKSQDVPQLRDSARASAEDTKRDLTSQEEDALAAMKRRDEDLEQQLHEVGLAVGRLDPLARQIGATAERQRLRAEALTAEVDKTEADMQLLNRRVNEVMRYEKNTSCCCQLCLMVVFLCCVGFIFQQLT